MTFKAAIAAFVLVVSVALALYWQNARLAQKLAQAEIRAANAQADLSLARVALRAQSAHTARISRLTDDQARDEETITRSESANDPADPATIDFIRRLGLLAD